MTISTRDLSAFPDPPQLKSLFQSLAMLDAILCPDWEYRYYLFDVQGGGKTEFGSMRNGQGDHVFCMFTPPGVILKGFAHESVMSPFQHEPPRIWPGVLDHVPAGLQRILNWTEIAVRETTFCIWHTATEARWQCGEIQFPDVPDPDGSAGLLSLLDGIPQSYQGWAETYYVRPVNLAAVMHIYRHQPLTAEIIHALNPDISIDNLKEDLDEIGYPSIS